MPAQLFFLPLIVLEAEINISDLFVARRKKIGMLEQLFLNLECIDADRPGNRPSKSKGRMGPKVSKKKNLRAEWSPQPMGLF
jgi:hypothetical protein